MPAPSMRWTKHLKEAKAKAELEARLSSCNDVLSVLKNILEEDLKALDKNMMSKDHYNTECWAYFQADQMGSKRTLTRIMELLP